MQIQQQIAIVIHGNAFLRGFQTAGFFPSHDSFKFYKQVQFVRLEQQGAKWREKPFAADPNDWFKRLAERRAVGLRLESKPVDRNLVAFAEAAGNWPIGVDLPDTSESWAERAEVANRDDPNGRIWKATYGRIAWDLPRNEFSRPALSGTLARMETVLSEISAFARREHLEGWASDCFEPGLQQLKSTSSHSRGTDLSPPGVLDPDAERALRAAAASWPFGGM